MRQQTKTACERKGSAERDTRSRSTTVYTVFKHESPVRLAYLPHEANVEQLFSRSDNLSDPNMDPELLAQLTSIAG
eukprot:1653008-Prymnesium_polylepis.1